MVINFFRNLSLKMVRVFTQSSYDNVIITRNKSDRLFAVEAAPPVVLKFSKQSMSVEEAENLTIDASIKKDKELML